jgi:uncharacterized protein (TIGR03067 family)
MEMNLHQKSRVIIDGTSLVRTVFAKDGRQLGPLQSTIWIDPTTDPKQFDDDAPMPFGKSRRPGIYKLEGDRLTICWNNANTERPTTFDSPTGSSFVLTVLRRQRK